MNKCLLCDCEKPGARKNEPDVDFICSRCIQNLAETPQNKLIEMYIDAVKQNRERIAYALAMFVPRAIRKKYRRKNLDKKKV